MISYAIGFGVGLVVGLLLNWRSWKALSIYIEAAELDRQTHRTMKRTNAMLWDLLDMRSRKIRH